MAINKFQGHWQYAIQYSPFKKAWRKDLLTGAIYTIDKWGNGLVQYTQFDLPRKARKEKLVGYLDWKPVLE